MLYVCIVEAEDKFYLMLNEDNSIACTKTPEEFMNSWTDKWESGLSRGSSWPASAMLSYIQYHPSVIGVSGIEEVVEKILGPGEHQALDVWGTSGGFAGVLCESEHVKEMWESGAKPALYHKNKK